MTRGVKTDAELVEAFRGEYLRTRNVAKSARNVGLPERTAWVYANEADDDPEFAEACRRLRVRALEEAERAVMDAVRVAHAEIEAGPPEPIQHDKGVAIPQDIRAQFMREVVNAHKSLTARAKFEAERRGEISRAADVTIKVAPTADAEAKLEQVGGD